MESIEHRPARLAGIAIAAFLLAGPAAAQTIELKAGDFQSTQHVLSKEGIVHWMRLVESKTGGKVKFTHFPSEQAAKARGLPDAVKSGALDVAMIGPLYNTDRLPLNSVTGLAGTYGSSAGGSPVLHDMTRKGPLADELAAEGAIAVFSVVLPPYQLLLKSKEARTVRDLAGLKIRTGGTTQALTARALGASGINLPGPEVYTALERGTVDGVIFPLSSVPGYNLQEVSKYISTNASFGGFGITVIMNKQVFEKLPADVRAAVLAAGDETMRHLAKAQDDSIEVLLKQWKEKGIVLFQYAPDQLAAISKAMASVNEEWSTRVGKQNPKAPAVLEEYLRRMAAAK
ncbi:MAG: TRAP transporter substrate-binding protein DctP [Alphaproteobacteria bacterium]